MLNWYLACYQFGKGMIYKAQHDLARLHINSFCPLIRLLRPRPDTSACRLIIEPFFPGYIFIEFDPEITHTTKLTALSSISHFVKFGNNIKPVSKGIIDYLMNLPFCPEEKEIINNFYKKKIISIAQINNKNERRVMFLTFIEEMSKESSNFSK